MQLRFGLTGKQALIICFIHQEAQAGYSTLLNREEKPIITSVLNKYIIWIELI